MRKLRALQQLAPLAAALLLLLRLEVQRRSAARPSLAEPPTLAGRVRGRRRVCIDQVTFPADVQAARDRAGVEAVGDFERLQLPQKGEGGRQGARDDVLFGVDLLQLCRQPYLWREGAREALAVLPLPIFVVDLAAVRALFEVDLLKLRRHPDRGWDGAREARLACGDLLECAGEEEGGGEGARDVGLLYPEPSEPGGRRGEGDRQRARNGGPLDVDHLEGRKEPELRRQRPPEAVDASPLDLGDLAFFARDKLLLAARDRRVDPRPPATHQHPRLSRRRRRSARRRQRGRRRLRWLRRRRRRPRRRRRRRGRRRRR
mmetsp:Transcript_44742/g.145384  ORF Transcript_44742/g.145384 Transcript_44742/m.145384 type:complete len:317 (+) Transcript_44742:405-1355(+)